jgi:hypothetical protein
VHVREADRLDNQFDGRTEVEMSQMLTARLARRSTHFMKIINVEDSRVLLGVFKHQHLYSCKRDLRAPARVIM